jgi:hypothetical protein
MLGGGGEFLCVALRAVRLETDGRSGIFKVQS